MSYATIRDCLGEIIGKKILDITQHDQDYFAEHKIGFIDLMLDSGDILRVWSLRPDEPWMALNPSGDSPEEIEME